MPFPQDENPAKFLDDFPNAVCLVSLYGQICNWTKIPFLFELTEYFLFSKILNFFRWTGSCLAIQCYQCGAEVGEDSFPCDIFVKAPMWRQFEVECPASPPHLCGKTITHYDDGSESSKFLQKSISPYCHVDYLLQRTCQSFWWRMKFRSTSTSYSINIISTIFFLSFSHHCGMTGEVRGCAPAENAFQVPNRIGCGRDADSSTDQTTFCLCGTDLCNGASRLSAHILPWPMTKLSTLSLAVFMLNFLILRTFLFSWRAQHIEKSHFCGGFSVLFLFFWRDKKTINVCTISMLA